MYRIMCRRPEGLTNFLAWLGSSPTYTFFQRQNVCSETPTLRIRSATGVPTSASFNTDTICSTENRLFFTTRSPFC
jgi:hypothetical protein